MTKDEELIELAHPEYWNERYTAEQKVGQDGIQPALDSYEWFRNFETLRSFFAKHLPASSSNCHILHLGCGNSVSLSFPSRNALLSYNQIARILIIYLNTEPDSGSSRPRIHEPDKRRLFSSSYRRNEIEVFRPGNSVVYDGCTPLGTVGSIS
jgi:hypothetical protein